MPEYQWDLAVSLLDRDLLVGKRVKDLLTDRVRVFLYSEEQRGLVGEDGVEKFTAVFRHEAHTVLVLSRSEWGHTPWTRVEATAIKNRVLMEGCDFLTFAPL